MAYEIFREDQIRPVRGVLFDMDGLVLDTEKLYTRFWMEAAAEAGHPMTLSQALGLRSLNREKGRAYLSAVFGEDVDYMAIRAIRIRRMDAFIAEHGVEPKPGIGELLDVLHARQILCAITTSSPQSRIEEYLRPLGLLHRFDALCSGYDVAHGKPEPDIYLYGAACIHVPPEECLALEDSPAGIESAFRAGCLPVMIPDQDRPDEETRSRCFAQADSLMDICTLLDTMK